MKNNMKVKYSIFDYKGYYTSINLYPEETKYEDFISWHTGDIIEFIHATLIYPDRFLIADDETKRFVKIDVRDCIKIDKDVDT